MDVTAKLDDLLWFARDVRAYFAAHGQLEGARDMKKAAQQAIINVGHITRELRSSPQAAPATAPTLAEASPDSRRAEIAAAPDGRGHVPQATLGSVGASDGRGHVPQATLGSVGAPTDRRAEIAGAVATLVEATLRPEDRP
jgi:hypothetical protein